MKVTKEMLKRIIKEELQSVLNESDVPTEKENKKLSKEQIEELFLEYVRVQKTGKGETLSQQDQKRVLFGLKKNSEMILDLLNQTMTPEEAKAKLEKLDISTRTMVNGFIKWASKKLKQPNLQEQIYKQIAKNLNEAGVDVEMELKTIIQDNWEKVSNAPYGQFKSIIAKLFSDKFPGEPIPSDKQMERASRDAYAPDRVLPAGVKRSSFPIDDEEEEF